MNQNSPGKKRGWGKTVVVGDLQTPGRIQSLFELAVERLRIPPGARVSFFATARSIMRRQYTPGKKINSPVGAFTACVYRRDWPYATADEEWARRAIRMLDVAEPVAPVSDLSAEDEGDDELQAAADELLSMPEADRLQLAAAAIRRAPRFANQLCAGQAPRILRRLILQELRERMDRQGNQ